MYREVNMLNNPLPSIVKGCSYSNPHYMLSDVYYTCYYKLSNNINYRKSNTIYRKNEFSIFSSQNVLYISIYILENTIPITSIFYPHYPRLSYC